MTAKELRAQLLIEGLRKTGKRQGFRHRIKIGLRKPRRR